MAEFKVDPYAVITDDKVDFGDLLEEIFTFSDDFSGRNKAGNRWGKYGNNWIIIDQLGEWRGNLIGTAFQARMRDLSMRGGANGISPLDLDDDEGLGKHVAFLWDRKDEFLWFQRDRNALTIGQFSDYVCDRSNERLEVEAVLDSSTLARALAMDRIRTVEISVIGAGSGEDEQIPYVGDFLRMNRRYGSRRLNVSLKPERAGVLNTESRKLVKAITSSLGRDIIVKARITGYIKENPEEEVLLDLLRDRLRFRAQISDARYRDPERLIQSMKQIWLKHRKEISE